ncbi:MAG: Ig-like domain-containing protein, partial [Acidimicrobiia bacterium]
MPLTTVHRRAARTRTQSTRRTLASALIALALLSTIWAVIGAGPAGALTPTSGYWMLDGTGRLFEFGAAEPHPAVTVAAGATAVKVESTADGRGVWIADSLGNVYPHGTAAVYGDKPTLNAGERIVTLSRTPSGLGYWLTSSAGRTFARGDATPLGDITDFTENHAPLNQPIIDSAPTIDGKGLYLVALDGGVFAMGGASFRGSMGGTRLNSPVRSLVPDPDGIGYWLIAGDGGVFAFDADFRGSMGGAALNKPVVGMVAFGNGYLQVGADGGIFNFSNLDFYGSLGGQTLTADIVGVAAFNRPAVPASITTANLPTGRVNQPFSFTLTGTALAPTVWTVSGLPAGLSMTSGGVITGTPTAAGTATVVARLTGDDLGTTTKSFSLIINPADAPVVTVTSPAASAMVAGSATTIAATATSATSTILGVQFLVDGVNVGAEDTTVPYSIAWDTTTATNGSHAITAVARTATDTGTSTARTVTVNNVSIVALAPVNPNNGFNWTVSATVTGQATSVDFYVDGVILNTQNHGPVSAAAGTYSQGFDAWTRSDGTHTLTAVAHPVGGFANVTSAARTFTISGLATAGDFTRPLVSLTFDDGWISHSTVAQPALDARSMKGTFYLLSDPTHPLDGNRFPYMSLAQLTGLRNAGMELAAHTIDHPHLTVAGPAYPDHNAAWLAAQPAGWLTNTTDPATAAL